MTRMGGPKFSKSEDKPGILRPRESAMEQAGEFPQKGDGEAKAKSPRKKREGKSRRISVHKKKKN